MAVSEASNIVKITPPLESLLITHTQNHGEYKCLEQSCSFTTSNPSLLGLHKAQVHKIKTCGQKGVTYQYFCPAQGCHFNSLCGRFFKVFDHLKTHYMKVHFEKKFNCHKCQRAFGLERDCLRHVKVCGKTFTCIDCSKVYMNKTALSQHCISKGHQRPLCLQKVPRASKKDQMKSSKKQLTPIKDKIGRESTLVPILPKSSLPYISLTQYHVNSNETRDDPCSMVVVPDRQPQSQNLDVKVTKINLVTSSDVVVSPSSLSEMLTSSLSPQSSPTQSALTSSFVQSSKTMLNSHNPRQISNMTDTKMFQEQRRNTDRPYQRKNHETALSAMTNSHLHSNTQLMESIFHSNTGKCNQNIPLTPSTHLACQLESISKRLKTSPVTAPQTSFTHPRSCNNTSSGQIFSTNDTSKMPNSSKSNIVNSFTPSQVKLHNLSQTTTTTSCNPISHSETQTIESFVLDSINSLLTDCETQTFESNIPFNGSINNSETQTFKNGISVYSCVNDSETQTIKNSESLKLFEDCDTQTLENVLSFDNVMNESGTQTCETCSSIDILVSECGTQTHQNFLPFKNLMNEFGTQTSGVKTMDSITQTRNPLTLDSVAQTPSLLTSDSITQTSSDVAQSEKDILGMEECLPLNLEDNSCQVDQEELFSLATFDMMTQTLENFNRASPPTDLKSLVSSFRNEGTHAQELINFDAIHSNNLCSTTNAFNSLVSRTPSTNSFQDTGPSVQPVGTYDSGIKKFENFDRPSSFFDSFDSWTTSMDTLDSPGDLMKSFTSRKLLPSAIDSTDAVTQTFTKDFWTKPSPHTLSISSQTSGATDSGPETCQLSGMVQDDTQVSVGQRGTVDATVQSFERLDSIAQTENVSDTILEMVGYCGKDKHGRTMKPSKSLEIDQSDTFTQTANGFDHAIQTSVNFDSMTQTTINFDIMTQTTNYFDIMTQTTNNFDIMTQTTDDFDNVEIMTQTADNFDIMTQTIDFDTMSQPTNNFDIMTQTTNNFDIMTQTTDDFDMTQTANNLDIMTQTINNFDNMTQTTDDFNIMTKTTNNLDIMTQTTKNLDIMTQTTNNLDIMTQTSNNLDIMTQTTNNLDTMTQTTNNFDIMTQTTNNFDIMTQTTNNFNIMTQTTNNFDIMTQTDGFDIMTQTTDDFDIMTQTTHNFDIMTQTTDDFDIMTQTTDDFDIMTQTTNNFDIMTQTDDFDIMTQTTNNFDIMTQTTDDFDTMTQTTHNFDTMTQTTNNFGTRKLTTTNADTVRQVSSNVDTVLERQQYEDITQKTNTYGFDLKADILTQSKSFYSTDMMIQTDEIHGSDMMTQTSGVDLWEMMTQTDQNSDLWDITLQTSFDLTSDIFTQTQTQTAESDLWEMTTQTDEVMGADMMTQTMDTDLWET